MNLPMALPGSTTASDSVTVPISDTFYIGMAASSGTTTALDSSVLDNLTITGGGVAPAAPSSLNGTAISSSRINLTCGLHWQVFQGIVSRGPLRQQAALIQRWLQG